MKRLLIAILLLVTILVSGPVATFALPASCAYAAYGPHLWLQCILDIMFENWDPLDWSR